MKNLPRILLSLDEVCGYFSHLKNGFKEIGYDADTAFVRKHVFAYETEQKTSVIQKLLLWNSKFLFSKAPIIFRVPFFISYRFFLLPVFFIECLIKYDIFIFGFKKTFLPFFWDLPILKFLGKKAIFVFFGSDSRPAYLNGALTGFSLHKIYKRTLNTKRDLVRIGKYADHIIDAPSSGIFHEQKIINWFCVGIPQKQDVVAIPSQGAIVTILHSPSNPEAKGTPIVKQVIDELKLEGYEFQYIEMINRTNQEVIYAISTCDFVIDQLYSDTPMATFATEAALYGKPAIVGGYEIDKVNALLPTESRPPSYLIHPSKEELKKAVIKLIENKEFRKNLGKKAQEFVHQNWNAAEVAKRYLRILNNDIPDEWYIDPYKMDFVHGCAIENERRKVLVAEYIQKYGRKELCMGDKKSLEEHLLLSISE